MTNPWAEISWPRQMSASADYPGYGAYMELLRRGVSVNVWLDGVEYKEVYAVDLDACTIIVPCRGADGNIIIVDDEIKVTKLKGMIKIQAKSLK